MGPTCIFWANLTPFSIQLETTLEQFDAAQFAVDVAALLGLGAREAVVVDSVLAGSVVVSFHIEGRATNTPRAVRGLQVGLGRVVALHDCPSTLYQIH